MKTTFQIHKIFVSTAAGNFHLGNGEHAQPVIVAVPILATDGHPMEFDTYGAASDYCETLLNVESKSKHTLQIQKLVSNF